MSAVDLSAGGGFAQLARAFVDLQAQEFLPLLPAAGVSDVKGALASTGALLLAPGRRPRRSPPQVGGVAPGAGGPKSGPHGRAGDGPVGTAALRLGPGASGGTVGGAESGAAGPQRHTGAP